MEKIKLIEARKKKGYSISNMAEELGVDEANYCRREKGQTKINDTEWEKLSQVLDVSVEDIYEKDENQFFICKDYASGNYLGVHNNIYTVPESMIETQQKYIKKLEEEVLNLKKRLKKYEK